MDKCYLITFQIFNQFFVYVCLSSHIRALVAGGCASVVGQTCIVPFDVISQHMMVVGMKQTSGTGGGLVSKAKNCATS